MNAMCDYGNCTEMVPPNSLFKLTITTSAHGIVTARQSFCCYEHGILWMQKKDRLLNNRNWPEPKYRTVKP